jgi:hypothetical protein
MSGPPAKPVAHAVVVKFDYVGSTDLSPLHYLEKKLEAAIKDANVVSSTATKLRLTAVRPSRANSTEGRIDAFDQRNGCSRVETVGTGR